MFNVTIIVRILFLGRDNVEVFSFRGKKEATILILRVEKMRVRILILRKGRRARVLLLRRKGALKKVVICFERAGVFISRRRGARYLIFVREMRG